MNEPTDSREIAAGDLPDYLRRAASAVAVSRCGECGGGLEPFMPEDRPHIFWRCVECATAHGVRADEWPPGEDKVPFTLDHLLAHLQIEADFVVDRFVVTRGQQLVLRDLLQRAHDEIERLNDENEALRIDLAAAYCRMDDMEGLNNV